MKHKIFVLFILAFLITGCKEPDINMQTVPKIQIPKKGTKIVRKKGALYSQQGGSLFADKKDLQIGDILQVIVSETLTNDSKGTRGLSEASSTKLGGGIFAPTTGNTLSNRVAPLINRINSNTGVGFSTATTNSFAGSATSKASEAFTTTMSVIIEQTYQNGNYYVKGSKELLIDGQKQIMQISGVIRPYDITPDNTINSNQLANLKIKYVKEGEENDSNHKGWGTKVIENIWPF